MQKALSYSTFIIASFIVAALFITSSNYTQLTLAVVLYPLLVYCGYVLFVRTNRHSQETIVVEEAKATSQKETLGITDIEKRAFLKLVGAAGISFFLFSLFNKRTNPLFFGNNSDSPGGLFGPGNNNGNKVEPTVTETQPLEGYTITEVDDIEEVSYYGFINKDGGWFIMRQDSDESSFRYIKGDSGFPEKWTNREQLKYDYYNNVF